MTATTSTGVGFLLQIAGSIFFACYRCCGQGYAEMCQMAAPALSEYEPADKNNMK
jgi:hypothetical protein